MQIQPLSAVFQINDTIIEHLITPGIATDQLYSVLPTDLKYCNCDHNIFFPERYSTSRITGFLDFEHCTMF